MQKTYNHYIDGKHVATYKQPTDRDIKLAELKDVFKLIISIALMIVLAYGYLLVM
jgi:hypothetical protein